MGDRHPILEPGADSRRTRRCDARRPGADRALLERYRQRRNPVDRDVLVERFLPLARGLARRYQRTGEPFDERRRALEALDRDRVRLQVSLDSATPELHDRHRGQGSFDRARAGMELARALGFRVRVAATIDAADATEREALRARLDADGIPPADQLIRPVARTGSAAYGIELTIDELWPEPTLTADGAWWHPVGISEPAMQIASTPLPVVTILAVIRATLTDPERDRTSALQAFRCT
jgi:hypothetical protein